MNNKTHRDTPQEAKTIGRRELLKALAATGGAITAASMLPGKWSKPAIEVGVLPAHAQQTGVFQIGQLNARQAGPAVQAERFPFLYQADFNYSDSAGQVNDSATIFASLADSGALSFNGNKISETSVLNRTGDGFAGTVSMFFNRFASNTFLDPTTLDVKMVLEDGREDSDSTTVPGASLG
jgi:hypothetical protein